MEVSAEVHKMNKFTIYNTVFLLSGGGVWWSVGEVVANWRNYKQGWIQRFWKEVVLYVGHHGWPTKKILGFRWSKKTKITLETISFCQNISISIFKFYPSLNTIKASQWNLINFSKFLKALIRKEIKHLSSSQWEDFVL